jgi:nicotinamidase-related amidase
MDRKVQLSNLRIKNHKSLFNSSPSNISQAVQTIITKDNCLDPGNTELIEEIKNSTHDAYLKTAQKLVDNYREAPKFIVSNMDSIDSDDSSKIGQGSLKRLTDHVLQLFDPKYEIKLHEKMTKQCQEFINKKYPVSPDLSLKKKLSKKKSEPKQEDSIMSDTHLVHDFWNHDKHQAIQENLAKNEANKRTSLKSLFKSNLGPNEERRDQSR